MPPQNAVADRPAIVVVIKPEWVEAGLLEQAFDDLREPVEGVLEALGHLGVAEARIVGGENVEPIRERRNQVAELVRRGGETAEQQQLRARRIPGLAVEDGESVHLRCAMSDHCDSFGSSFFVSTSLRPDQRGPYVRDVRSRRETTLRLHE